MRWWGYRSWQWPIWDGNQRIPTLRCSSCTRRCSCSWWTFFSSISMSYQCEDGLPSQVSDAHLRNRHFIIRSLSYLIHICVVFLWSWFHTSSWWGMTVNRVVDWLLVLAELVGAGVEVSWSRVVKHTAQSLYNELQLSRVALLSSSAHAVLQVSTPRSLRLKTSVHKCTSGSRR